MLMLPESLVVVVKVLEVFSGIVSVWGSFVFIRCSLCVSGHCSFVQWQCL